MKSQWQYLHTFSVAVFAAQILVGLSVVGVGLACTTPFVFQDRLLEVAFLILLCLIPTPTIVNQGSRRSITSSRTITVAQMAFRISRTAGLLSLAATLLSNGVTGGPIMGWNTYDCYNGAAPESDVLNAAQYMADNLAQYGWNLIEIDGGWSNSIDGYGRQVPNTKLYPSSTVENGLLNISSQIHALGLKFGVWTIRGIPKLAVEQNLPIFNSTFTAKDAARLDTNCRCGVVVLQPGTRAAINGGPGL